MSHEKRDPNFICDQQLTRWQSEWLVSALGDVLKAINGSPDEFTFVEVLSDLDRTDLPMILDIRARLVDGLQSARARYESLKTGFERVTPEGVHDAGSSHQDQESH